MVTTTTTTTMMMMMMMMMIIIIIIIIAYHDLSETETRISPVLHVGNQTPVNKKDSVNINLILRRVHVAIVAAETLHVLHILSVRF
jgi:hypothetical protein